MPLCILQRGGEQTYRHVSLLNLFRHGVFIQVFHHFLCVFMLFAFVLCSYSKRSRSSDSRTTFRGGVLLGLLQTFTKQKAIMSDLQRLPSVMFRPNHHFNEHDIHHSNYDSTYDHSHH